MATTTRNATYKGRTYRLLYIGDTRFGRRAHLEFTDGTKDFWVDARAITETGSYPSRQRASTRECCWAMCPVSGRKCTPSDPCHDCQ